MPNEPPLRRPGVASNEIASGTTRRPVKCNAILDSCKYRSDFQLFRYRALVLLVLGSTMLLAGCSGKKATEEKPVVEVQAVHVERSTIQQQVTADAALYPLHRATIVPKISAPIQKFYVSRGDHVHAGELLAELENSDLAAVVAETKGAYEQAEANYESTSAANLPEQIQKAEAAVKSAKASYKAARQLYDSSKKLYKQGALAGKQLNQAEVGLTQAEAQLQTSEQQLEKLHSVGLKAQLKAAKGQLAAAKGRYENAKAQLDYSKIRSPIDGVVTDRPLYRGEMATPSTPLMTVMNLSRVVARAHIPASEAEGLKVGTQAEIFVTGMSKPVPGKVTVVSPALDPNSTTVQVWVEARNPGDQLKPGLTVNVTIIPKKVSDALVIPREALLASSNHSGYVMVIGSHDHAHRTKVETGIEQDGKVQIVSGLKDGELIVGQGAYGLPNGVRVKY